MRDPEFPCMGKVSDDIPSHPHTPVIESYLNLFRKWDTQRDGTIELAGLKDFFHQVSPDLTDSDFVSMLVRSKSCKVSYEQYLKWAFSPTAPTKQRIPKETFRTTSKNMQIWMEMNEADDGSQHCPPINGSQDGQNDESIQSQKKPNLTEAPCKVANPPNPKTSMKVNWRCGTWNAAGEVTKFEFLPLPCNFTDKVERLLGAAILELRGTHKDLALYKSMSWARYKVWEEWPQKEDVDFINNLSIKEMLKDFDVNQLCDKWARWLPDNPSGKQLIETHIENWSQIDLVTLCRVAMGKEAHEKTDEGAIDKISGLKEQEKALISNADSWFSERTYHIRGDQWLEFVKDATNENFTGKQFWARWINGLAETYKWEADKPIQFAPTRPGFDYVAAALWDRLVFLVASRVALADEAPKDDAEIQMLKARVDISKDEVLGILRSKLDWVINTAKVQVICLQEADSLVPPQGWRCFPKSGSSTVVWVAESHVNEEMTRKAEQSLAAMKEQFSEAGKMKKELLQKMKSEIQDAVKRTTEGFGSNPHCLLRSYIEEILTQTSQGLDKVLEDTLNLTDQAKQFNKIQRWFATDKVAVAVAKLGNEECLVCSAHGESAGYTSRQVLMLAKCLHQELSDDMPELGLVIGMDANVKTSNKGAACTPEVLLRTAKWLGLSYCATDCLKYAGLNGRAAENTVVKTRTFLQAQQTKAGISDANLKDYVFYCPPKTRTEVSLRGRVINYMTENDDEGLYVEGGMPRGREFPSDHALVIVQSESPE